ncbi:MAG: hypothetical protein BWY91_02027 [bacterium ADurb.BinA028]|nr:MAG: hypothetical protein BWY91_02027 [bacterium ADurb.BinA028]
MPSDNGGNGNEPITRAPRPTMNSRAGAGTFETMRLNGNWTRSASRTMAAAWVSSWVTVGPATAARSDINVEG